MIKTIKMPSDTKTYIYLCISLGIFILNGKLSTRKVESSSDSPPHAQKQIFLVVSLDRLQEYKDILLANKISIVI